MKYVPPYGRESEGDLANYINGNPKQGVQGSIPPANAFEHPMRELVAVISKSHITPADSDLMQAAKGIRSQYMNWAVDSGSVNNLSVVYDPPLGDYTVGLTLRVRVANTNTGAATIDAGGSQGRVAIKRMNGSGLAAGDLVATGIVELCYDGTGFQMLNYLGTGGAGGSTVNNYVNIPYCVADAASSANIVIAVFSNPPNQLTAGDPMLVKMIATNTGSAVLRVKAGSSGPPGGWHPDKPISANGGGALLQGDMQAGDVVLFIYDGSTFWISPNPIINADTTINVPAQYSTVDNALLAIRRKTIAQNAMVTILLAGAAAGAAPLTYAPFRINHANVDRITIRGQLKSAGNLTSSFFAQNGPGATARANDSNYNITQLRTKYGTEIVVPSGGSFTAGIVNDSASGTPTIADMLITGPGVPSGDPIARWVGCGLTEKRSLRLSNVSTWGLDVGFYGGGNYYMTASFACGCARSGTLLTSGAFGSFNACGFFGNAVGGVVVNQNSTVNAVSSWSNSNGAYGCSISDVGELTWNTSQAQNNGVADVSAGAVCEMIVQNAAVAGGVGTYSPGPNSMNAYGGYMSVS